MPRITPVMLFFVWFLLIISSLPACRRKICPNDCEQRWQCEQFEAKLYDVPIFLNAQSMRSLVSSPQGDEATIISYEVSVDCDTIIAFYQEEMERLGWWQTVTCRGSESLLSFDKPNKYCSISVRPGEKILRIVLFVAQKSYK